MNFYKCNKKGAPSINVQSSKTVTAGTTQQTVTPDTGYDAMGEVVVNPTPSIPITPSSSGTQFSAGLNDMSSSGWAYDSQQSGGTIKYSYLTGISPTTNFGSFDLSDADYNLIHSGKAILVAGMVEATVTAQAASGANAYIKMGISSSSITSTIISSINIGNSKKIYYKCYRSQQMTSNYFIYFVYIE